MTGFWLVLWSVTLSIGWLLPNHYFPWLSFHSDAWVALVLSIAAVAVIFRSQGFVVWHRLTVLVAFLVFIPWIQYFFGMITLAGTAWISSIYLLGLLLALITGARWESSHPGQFADGLFLAIGVAAILSVGLQLQQWLALDGLELWVMGGGSERPHANFGQPNQLGTFLLWGLLAAAWGLIRKQIGIWTTLLLAAYLLFGLALTGSRTAWVGIALLVTSVWLWRRLWITARLPWVVTGLGAFFVLCVVGLGSLQVESHNALLSQPVFDNLNRPGGNVRLMAWSALIDAATQRPFFGYGWNQGILAHMVAAVDHPPLNSAFGYSHNLFLDLVLWCGIPLGLLISFSLVWWLLNRLRAVRCAENAVLLLFLLVVANHAMLELPLHFAYFLLPVGIVMGGLNTRLHASPVLSVGRWNSLGILLIAIMILVLIIRDYSRIEPNHRALRLEWSGMRGAVPAGPPDVLLLTQWHEYFRYARLEPQSAFSENDLNWMRNITGLFPNIIFFHKLATALAMNQHPEEAKLWLQRMCKMAPEVQCRAVEKKWAIQSLKNPKIAAVSWPTKIKSND